MRISVPCSDTTDVRIRTLDIRHFNYGGVTKGGMRVSEYITSDPQAHIEDLKKRYQTETITGFLSLRQLFKEFTDRGVATHNGDWFKYVMDFTRYEAFNRLPENISCSLPRLKPSQIREEHIPAIQGVLKALRDAITVADDNPQKHGFEVRQNLLSEVYDCELICDCYLYWSVFSDFFVSEPDKGQFVYELIDSAGKIRMMEVSNAQTTYAS